MGGPVTPLDDALMFIADDGMLPICSEPEIVQSRVEIDVFIVGCR